MATKNAKKGAKSNNGKKGLKDLKPKKSVTGGGKPIGSGPKGDITDPANPGN
jgi:hypothetical protein